MELLVLGGAAIAALLVAIIVLLVRSVTATRATRDLLASNGVAVGPGSSFHAAKRSGHRTGNWMALVFVLLTVVAFVVATVATVGSEPTALELFGPGAFVLAIPILLLLGLLAGTWVGVCVVRELHRWLQVADLDGHTSGSVDATGDTETPSTGAAASEAADTEALRTEGLRLLRRVTWSQAGVTGVGVVAGTLSVLFGAVLVAALFALAATAIACARNPKCI